MRTITRPVVTRIPGATALPWAVEYPARRGTRVERFAEWGHAYCFACHVATRRASAPR